MSGEKFALFVSIPFVGHLNPLLRQAEELACRGWRVGIASTHEVKAFVESDPCVSQGVEFLDLGSVAHWERDYIRFRQVISQEKSFLKTSLWIVNSLFQLWPFFFDNLTELVRQDPPDIIISDFVTRAALDVAEAEEIPAVVNNPCLLTAISIAYLPLAHDVPLPFLGHSIHRLPWHTLWTYPCLRWLAGILSEATIGAKLNTLRATRGLGKININQAWGQYPVIVNGAFGLEYPRPLPANIKMLGPMLPSSSSHLSPEDKQWLARDLPVVYVNLGTITMASSDLIQRMFESFIKVIKIPMKVWWILHPDLRHLLPDSLPAHLRIQPWGPPPLSVLQHPNVRVFVSHCGINSVQESIAAGTPIVGIPMFADQWDMALRVQDAGVGLILNKHSFSSEALQVAIERVLNEPTFSQPIPNLQNTFSRAGGVKAAADLIESEVSRGLPSSYSQIFEHRSAL
ncbi:MAG: glycosyltransferase [Cyanobacteriota bacterium]